ncbi:hypothetical protein KNP414_02231 [Paenibacillus mucilaginosus KNP414]|uniref:Uncharacterized protein n=1 Tax=Paenibacillus mucilaginosus (strain KNP414) TaxID=1036673 RepID=F8F562_PAEMK|nr:hypothetical protein KNP414_02231 [Paenibacillus mucilaginosus KNP414]
MGKSGKSKHLISSLSSVTRFHLTKIVSVGMVIILFFQLYELGFTTCRPTVLAALLTNSQC